MQSISSKALPFEAWVPPAPQATGAAGFSALYPAARRQWLAVDGFVTDRFLVSYRAPRARLAALVPAPFTLDEVLGYGFLSVCVLEVRAMGIRGLPQQSPLRFHNVEVLYRLGVRFRGQPTFVTLRSDTSSRALAWLGGCFSHYRLRRARIELSRSEHNFTLEAHTPDASGDAWFDVARGPAQAHASTSIFASAEAADRQLLGMAFSVDPGRGAAVLCQPIEHSPWHARFVEPKVARFSFLERLSRDYAVPLSYDNTLLMQNIRQTWLRAQWVRVAP